MLYLPTLSVESVFLCPYALTPSSFYHNLRWLKQNFLIDEFTKYLPIQSVGSLIPLLQPPESKNDILFFRVLKKFLL